MKITRLMVTPRLIKAAWVRGLTIPYSALARAAKVIE